MTPKTLSEAVREACLTHDIYSILGLDSRRRVFVCPLPSHVHHNNTPSFSIFTRDNKQYFKCHGNCGLEGDVVDLVGYLRVSGYNRRDPAHVNEALKFLDERYEYSVPQLAKEVKLTGAEWRDFLPPGEEVIRYGASRGLSVETLQKFKVGQCGKYMAMPCFEEGILRGIKMRSIFPTDLKHRFWQLEGSRIGLFNFDAVQFATDLVFIVKGEIPVMLMDQLGFLACAPTTGEGSWSDNHRTALALAPKITIGDNDGPGRKLGEKRAALFGSSLYFPPDPFKDIDEWLLAKPDEAVPTLNRWREDTLLAWW